MRNSLSVRLMLLALLVCLIPASSFGAVLISVNIAPPVMPVYVQPVCPEPDLMWTPGYWAYDYNAGDYYWVPGAWVPAPEVGMLWTPGYWGWGAGLYVWHPGYWGPQVGYYGGVNYGFGYMGVGFVGGMWLGGVFAYNTAVMHVGVGGPWAGDRVYVDRTTVERNTIVNDRHVAFSGGPGGINHPPTAAENTAMHQQHMAPTSVQTQHEGAAMQDRGAFSKNNGGHPATVAVARPLTAAGGAARPGKGNSVISNTSVNSNTSARSNSTAAPGGPRGGKSGQDDWCCAPTSAARNPNGGGNGGSTGNGQPGGSINYNSSKSNSGNVKAGRDAGGFSSGTQVHGNAQAAPPPASRPAPAPAARPAPAAPPAPQSHPAPKNESHEKEK